MNKKECEQSTEFAMEVVKNCEYATLATINADGTPYCIAISPAVCGNTIYFHGATHGKKVDNINRNNSICLSCVSYTELDAKKFTTKYKSAVVSGKCYKVEGEEKHIALMEIVKKYASENIVHAQSAIEKWDFETLVFKIVIDNISGKATI